MRITYFPDDKALVKDERDVDWPAFVASVDTWPTYERKGVCWLISLGRYGDTPSDKACLRHGGNWLGFTGVEVDYDDEAVTIEEAAEMFRAARIEALLYTSARNMTTDEKGVAHGPRWRVLLPTSREISGEDMAAVRKSLIARVNGALGGIINPESFNTTQAFYIGKVKGVPFAWAHSVGDCIDTRTDIPEIYTERGEGSGRSTFSVDDAVMNIETGEILQASINRLGMADWTVEEIKEVMQRSAAKDRLGPSRASDWKKRFDDIERCTAGAKNYKERAHQKLLKKLPIPPLPTPAAAVEPEGAPKRLLKRLSDVLANIRPADWLIRKTLERNSVACVFGHYSAAKSLLVIDWAARVATGTPWNGRKVQKGVVVYIAGEGHNGLKRRFEAWQLFHGVSIPPENLYITEEAMFLNDPTQFYREVDAVNPCPVMIILDTVGSLVPGLEQNDSASVTRFMTFLKSCQARYNGAVILFVHHAGKGDTGTTKGSIDFEAMSDAVFGMKKPDAKMRVKTMERELFNPKQKEAEEFEPIQMLIKVVQLPRVVEGDNGMPENETAPVLVFGEHAPPQTPVPPDADADLMKSILRQSGLARMKYGALKAEFVRLRNGKDKANRTAFEKTFERLCQSVLTFDQVNDDVGLILGMSQNDE